MPCSVCFNSKTSKLDGHLSTLADKLLFILLENTDNCSLRFYKLCIILQTETTRAVTHTGLRTEILVNFIFVSLCRFAFDCLLQQSQRHGAF